MNETVKDLGFFKMKNVESATNKIKTSLQLKTEKNNNLFKKAIKGFSSLIKEAEIKIKLVEAERKNRIAEINILSDTINDIVREKTKVSIIESRFLSLLEVSDKELDTELGIVQDEMIAPSGKAKK